MQADNKPPVDQSASQGVSLDETRDPVHVSTSHTSLPEVIYKSKWAFPIFIVSILVIITALAGGWLFSKINSFQIQSESVTSRFASTTPLTSAIGPSEQLQGDSLSSLLINGELTATSGVVLKPSAQPTDKDAVTGKLYYDKETNQPYYYDGQKYISLRQSSSVRSIGGIQGDIRLGNGLTTTGGILNTTPPSAAVRSLTGTPNQINVSSSQGDVTLSLTQDLAVTSTPNFAGVNLAVALGISSGGTGAATAEDARINLGAAVSGVNNDITNLNALTAISPMSALTIGSTNQALTLQGNGSTVLTSTSGGNTTTLAFASPIGNTLLSLPASPAGSYTICTTVGNCLTAGAVTTTGGTTGRLARFSSSTSIVNSIIADNGSTVTIAGSGIVQGAGGLSLGTSTSANGKLVFYNSFNANSLTLQSGASSSNLTFTLPTFDGSSGQCLSTNGSGALTFNSCLTGAGAGGGVASLNGLSGTISIANASASIGTITIDNASTATKGIASFNAANFTVTSGVVNTVQDIAVTASPTFAGLTLTGSGGLTVGQTGTPGSIALSDGSAGFKMTLNTSGLTANRTLTLPDTTGVICVQGSITCGFASDLGSNNYIQNGTGLQLASNFNIQSASAGGVGGSIRAATSQTANLFQTQGSLGTVLSGIDATGNIFLSAGQSLKVTGSSAFPSSPTEGQVYYRSDNKQLYVYANGKWQADRSTATVIVAASNTINKEKADYIGDGTNDQTAINSAIAAVPSSGGLIVLLEGTYNIAATINMNKSNVTLQGNGNGTILKRMYNEIGANVGGVISILNTPNVTVQELKIDGNKANYNSTNNYGVFGSNSCAADLDHTHILSNYIMNTAGDGIKLSGTACLLNRYQKIADNVVTGATGNGIYGVYLMQSMIERNRLISNGGHGIFLPSGASNTVTGNTSNSNTGSGMSSDASTSTFSANVFVSNAQYGITGSMNNPTITSNVINSNTLSGIYLTGGTASANISGNSLVSNVQYGIIFNYSAGPRDATNSITSNTIDSSGFDGIYFHQFFGASTIANNNINNSGGSSAYSGIHITSGVQKMKIMGNTISDTAGTGYAIQLDSTSLNTYLSSNVFSGTGASSMLDNGTGTIYANQLDNGGNLVTRGQAGVGINTLSPTASLQNTGAFVQGGLATPGAPAVTTAGTAGSTTYGYKVTAYDGLGETLPSTQTSIATSNATLDSTNYNVIVPARVSGAVSYKIYRTAAGGTPSTTGLIGTISGGATSFFLNDTGLGATTAPPTTGTSGNATVSGNLAVGNVTASNRLTVNTATTADSLAQGLIATGAAANKGLVIQGATSQSGTLLEIQNSVGTPLVYVSAVGDIGLNTGQFYRTTSNNAVLGATGLSSNSGLSVTTGNALSLTAQYGVNLGGSDAGSNRLKIQGAASQAGDLLQFQNSSNFALSGFDASGNLYLGKASAISGGLRVYNASGAGSISLAATNPSAANYTILLPAESGTICTTASVCAGYSAGSGSGSYIQNQSATPQTANAYIQSASAATVGVAVKAAASQTADLLQVQNSSGTPLSGIDSSGNLYVAAGQSLKITGSTTFPSSPTEGQIYYKTDTKQLYVYANGKWQADRSTATLIVAASDSQNKEKADFVGDGTNDQTAINNAISALPSTGGMVVLLDGTYNITATVAINKANTSIEGQGNSTVLKRMFNSSSVEGVATFSAGSTSLAKVKIDGNKASFSSSNNNALYLASGTSPNVKITNNTIINPSGYGVSMFASGSVNNFVIADNTISGSTTHAITFDAAYVTIARNIISGNGGSGVVPIANNGLSNTTITENKVFSNTGVGILAAGVVTGNLSNSNTGGGISVIGSGAIAVITGNTMQNNTGYGLNIGAGVSNANATGNTVSGTTGPGIYIDSGNNNTVANNLTMNNTQAGVLINNAAAGNTVSGNRIYNNGGSGSASGITMTVSATSAGNKIINNDISDTAGTGFAIAVTGTGTQLSGNTYSGTGAASISDSGTGTSYIEQLDANNGLITRTQAGIALNGTSSNYSLQNTGALVQGGLATPAAPSVTVNGTTGSTTYGYKVTAFDGLGETLASTETQVTTGNATLTGVNFNAVVPARVSGAVSYKIYRTTAGGTPATTGLIGTLAGGAATFQFNDTGLAATTAVPASNTTGAISSSGTLSVASGLASINQQGRLTTTAIFQGGGNLGSLASFTSVSTGDIGVVIRGSAGQTADLLQAQDSTGTVLSKINAAGALTVTGATVNGTIRVTGGSPSSLAIASTATPTTGLYLGSNYTAFVSAAVPKFFFQDMPQRGFVLASNTPLSWASTVDATASAPDAFLSRNSASVLRISSDQGAGGASLIVNSSVGIATTSTSNPFSINSAPTSDSLAQALIATGVSTNKGLVIQGSVSQTADLLQTKDSSGAVLAKIDSSGSLTVANATVNGNLTVTGHIITGGSTPGIAAGVASCTTPTVAVSGNDTSGKITITTGTGCASTGKLAAITFASAFGAIPKVVVSPGNAAAAGLQSYIDGSTLATTAFDLSTATTPANTTTYIWYYYTTQ